MMNARTFMEWFNRAIEPIKNRLMLMVSRGVSNSVDDGSGIQTMQLTGLAGETKRKVPSIQHYGFSSHPPPGADLVMLSVNGNRENAVVVGTEHRDFRFTALAEGDAIIYNKNGKFIHLIGDDVDALLSKLSIRNDQHELVAVLSEFMQEVIDSQNETALGPLPLTPATIAKMQLVKDKLDTFKV